MSRPLPNPGDSYYIYTDKRARILHVVVHIVITGKHTGQTRIIGYETSDPKKKLELSYSPDVLFKYGDKTRVGAIAKSKNRIMGKIIHLEKLLDEADIEDDF